jgi:hypothetical protein
MFQALPTGNLKWVHSKPLPSLHKLELEADSKTGHALEVDMYLPREHHKNLKEFPPLCERTTIFLEELSLFDIKCNRDPDRPEK